jgi:hypothetical protein
MMGLGIGQRTFLAGADEVTASTTETMTSPVTIIDGSALNAFEQSQTVEIAGTPTMTAAYGRTEDVMAWVGNATYTLITFDETTGELVSTVTSGEEAQVPQLQGSDLWLREYTGETSLRFRVTLPEDVSIIAVSDGITPAPSSVSVSWPLDNTAPWSGPLVAAGAGFLLLGLIFLIWALTHMRKSRGPRRTQQKQPKMPKLPRQPRYKPGKPKALTSSKGRRATRRMVAFVPAILVGSLALTGCTTAIWPSDSVSSAVNATPTPTATDAAPETKIDTPAVTEAQMSDIINEIGTVVAQADANKDKDLLATRMTGPALEYRLANYAISTADAAVGEVPTSIPVNGTQLILPQQGDDFPRIAFAVIEQPTDPALPEAETAAPTAIMLVQEDARSNYKISYATVLQAGIALPEVAPVTVGAARVNPDFKLLQMAPADLAGAYVDILMNDAASTTYPQFDLSKDQLLPSSGVAGQAARKAELSSTAEMTFAMAAGSGEVTALTTADSGAIVAVQVTETETVKPVKSGAAVRPQGAVKALLGKESSATGVSATYSDQLLFYIPSLNEPGQVQLLGFGQGLLEAKELP